MSRLVAHDLSYRYPSGFTVGPVTLALGPGIHLLAGPNGAGKTTLLRCLCGAIRRARGTLQIDGLDPRHDPEARRRIALLSAEPELPDVLTVDEAWSQLAAIRGAPGWDGLSLRQALDVPGHLPLSHCSAGQRRVAELLAAAAGDPGVLLLDEPLANLDPPHVERVCGLLQRWRADRVVLMTSHTPPPVRLDSTVHLSATAHAPQAPQEARPEDPGRDPAT